VRIKPAKIEIVKENPFLNDLLERKESAEILTELVASIEEPFVFCIDAAWGDGKTTFLLMWKQHLENQDFSTLYYNAWENDFTDDALVSLIGELDAGVEDLKLAKGTKTKAKAHLQKMKKNRCRSVKEG
jgi:predicted AAA+ superfamily ATPase